MIVIVDYGMGNLRSVQKAFQRVGYQAEISSDPAALWQADKIALPGVGAFGMAMANIHQMGLYQPICDAVQAGKPLLGICLGLQLLFTASEEMGYHQGFGFIPGQVVRLPDEVRVPHIGWNQVNQLRAHPLLAGIPNQAFFYFVHSYYVCPQHQEVVVGTTDYGPGIASVVARGSVYGIQFHPEKSQEWGLRILANFGAMV